jgi:hypothetical protein
VVLIVAQHPPVGRRRGTLPANSFHAQAHPVPQTSGGGAYRISDTLSGRLL